MPVNGRQAETGLCSRRNVEPLLHFHQPVLECRETAAERRFVAFHFRNAFAVGLRKTLKRFQKTGLAIGHAFDEILMNMIHFGVELIQLGIHLRAELIQIGAHLRAELLDILLGCGRITVFHAISSESS
jgi:hypothetical protein